MGIKINSSYRNEPSLGTSGTSGESGIMGSSGISGTSGTSGESVTGSTYTEFYYDTNSKKLFVPSLNISQSTFEIQNIQNIEDNNTKLVLSGVTLYQVTGITGSGSLSKKSITNDYTLVSTDEVIFVSGSTNSTINLTMSPISNSNPNGYLIKNIGFGIINFNIYGSEYIDDNTTFGITNHNTSIRLIPFLNKWYIF